LTNITIQSANAPANNINAGASLGTNGEAKQNMPPIFKSMMLASQPIPISLSPVKNCEEPAMKKDTTTPTHGL
jgi:hypothetical protein